MGNLDMNNTGSDAPLAIASFDVANLDPYPEAVEPVVGNNANDDLGEGGLDAIATRIVNLLKSPDIIALPSLDANFTAQTLIDAIADAGGPQYAFFDIPPENSQGGGQPGSNRRLGYLYNPERLDFIEGSGERIVDPDLSDGDAFENSPKPLAARFEFNQQQIVLVDNRLSQTEVSPLVANSPGQLTRTQIVEDYVNAVLAHDPQAKALVLPDLSNAEMSSLTATTETDTATDAIVNIIGTSASEVLIGTDGNDIIYGLRGRDQLTGGLGDDILVGGMDGDMLTGGAGADQFVFNSLNERTDWITDFDVREDKLILTDVMAELNYQGTDPIADGTMQFFEWGSSVRVQFDNDGTGPAVFTTLVELTLTGNATAADLVIGENVIL